MLSHKISKRLTVEDRIFSVVKYSSVIFAAVICFIPFYLLVVSSLTAEKAIYQHGYAFIPAEWSTEAYRTIFSAPKRIINAYKISIFTTVVGTFSSLLLSSMAAYVLYRKDVKYRNQLAFFLFFTTLFNGGLLPYYILITRYLSLRNTLTILLISPMFSVMHILIMRNFIKGSIPDALIDSSQIDGCNDFWIYINVVLPLAKPALAAIGFFTALGYWNDWWTSMMFVSNRDMQPLQYVLYQILSKANFASNMVASIPRPNSPKESLKLAMVVVATGPIIFLYPFIQKYFVSGITIGSVKG